jgi:hypothetical protein
MTTSIFRDEIQAVINRNSMECGSHTPDFILAKYLTSCLEAFDVAVRERETWYSRDPERGPGQAVTADPVPLSDNPLHNIGQGRGDAD